MGRKREQTPSWKWGQRNRSDTKTQCWLDDGKSKYSLTPKFQWVIDTQLFHLAGIPFFLPSAFSLSYLVYSALRLFWSCFLWRPLTLLFPVSQCSPPQTIWKLAALRAKCHYSATQRRQENAQLLPKRLRKAKEPLSVLLMKNQQRNSYSLRVSSSPLVKAAISSLFPRLKAPQGPGRWLPMAPHHPKHQRSFLSPCLPLTLLSYKATAENLVLQLPLEHRLLAEAQVDTEATWACMLTSLKAAWSLISFGLHCVHHNYKQVDHHGICFAHFVTQLPHTLLRSTRLNKEFSWEIKKKRVNHASSA